MKVNYKEIFNEQARLDPSIREITKEESESLKKCLYEMAVDLDDRCRKVGIHLFLTGGSLLGAVRHKGFIPWDDDMDFGLIREEYDKFIQIFNSEFSDDYEMRVPNSVYPNGNRFMQIYKKGTVLKTIEYENPFQPNSIFIDVFPYDYVPCNKLKRLLKGVNASLLMFISSCVFDEVYADKEYKELMYRNKEGHLYIILRRIVGKLFRFHRPEKWFNISDKSIQYKKSTNLITSATGRRHYFGEMYPTEIFLPLTEIEFLEHSFFSPNQWDKYLVGNYGKKYMELPPKDQRESHYIKELEV